MIAFVLVVVGGALLVAGAELFAEHVARVANWLGITVVGVGILLAGAEPEEAATAVIAAIRDAPGLAVGDTIGANFVILTLTLGLAALVAPIPVSGKVLRFALAAAVTAIGPVLVLLDGVVTRWEGAVLVAVFIAVVVWIWRVDRRPPMLGELAEMDEDELTGRGGVGDLALALSGIGLMVAGGFVAVRGAEGLLDVLGLRESTVGLTVLAFATSAEMLALVWSAGRRGLTEVVVAGAVGCVLYNSTVSLGLAALARPLNVGSDPRLMTMAIVVAALPLALVLGRRKGVLGRGIGALLAATYAVGAITLFAVG